MKRILFLVLLLVATTGVYGQKFAVKSNLLYDATATINLGVEVGLAKKWSLDLSGNYNGWKLGDEVEHIDLLAELSLHVHILPMVREMKSFVPEFKSQNSQFTRLDGVN